MEKSRAIELLEHFAWDRDIDRNPYGDALNMAIEALKAQLSSEGTTSDLISRQAAIDAAKDWYEGLICGSVNGLIKKLKALPTVQPEPSIPLSWIEKHIEWLKGIDNEFAKLVVGYISIMLKKWRDEQNETD